MVLVMLLAGTVGPMLALGVGALAVVIGARSWLRRKTR
jgi:hypothetical protein